MGWLFGLLLALAQAPPQYAAALRQWGGDSLRAEQVADAVAHWSAVRNVDPTIVLGIIRVEDPELKVHARAKDGSSGVMQIQPFWRHSFASECGRDLFDPWTNVCYGTAILALNVKATHTTRAALLRYNGCKSMWCRWYADSVLQAAQEVRDAL